MHLWLIYDEADVEKNRRYIQMYETECALRAIRLTLLIRQKLRIKSAALRHEEELRMPEAELPEKSAALHREEELWMPEAKLPDESAVALYEGKPIALPQAVINRSRDAYLTMQLERLGVPVYNNSLVAAVGNDKGKLYTFLRDKDIPMMETVVCTKETGRGALPYPCVVKSCSGHGGSEVFLVHDDAEYDAACDQIACNQASLHAGGMQNQVSLREGGMQNHAPLHVDGMYNRMLLYGDGMQNQIVVQRLASETGKDLRVYVIGNEIVAGMLRTSGTDFRSNFSLGGHAQVHALTEEEETLVRKIMRHFTFGLVGIDLIYDNGHPVLNEIEDVVGARMLYAHTDINLVGRYIDYITSAKWLEKKRRLC